MVGDSASCGLFEIDLLSTGSLSGAFQTTTDVALFSFTLDEETHLQLTTSSYADGQFDPNLALFDTGGTILQILDPAGSGELVFARSFDIDLFADALDDQIDLVLSSGTYVLALAYGGFRESLQGGFDYSCEGCTFDNNNQFTLGISATPTDGGPAPIPEPGTLTLVAGGAIAGLLQRRRRKSRPQPA